MRKGVKLFLITIICIVLSIPLIVLPTLSIYVYETIFGIRYETSSWEKISVSDYEGLLMERSDFQSDEVTLAGYKYSKDGQETKGVVVIAHGLGGGGHNTYLPFIDYFTSSGYYVFAYDACGNDNSGGDSVEGLPRGLVDLDNAISHVSCESDYENLPITLFGHSWGGYSVGNVLYMHPEIKAAVIVAGFNESEDMLLHQGNQMAGSGADVILPYFKLYERLKFGKEYTDLTAVEAMGRTEAGIMIIHSADDTTVPIELGYNKFFEAFGDDERFEFVLYEDRGHDLLFYSEETRKYRGNLLDEYHSLVDQGILEGNDESLEFFMNDHVDKDMLYGLDTVLMESIIEMFDEYTRG